MSAAVGARRLALRRRFEAAAPFRHLVLDRFLEPAFCGRLVDEFPPYEPERFRNEKGDLGKATREDVRGLGPAFQALDDLASSPEFLRLLSDLTGIEDLIYDPDYAGGGTHENLEGMELDPHVDFNYNPKLGLHRRLNLMLYLNPEWRAEWGGCLELHEDPRRPVAQDRVERILPLFNRCALFETSERSWHGFQVIRLPKERRGLTRRAFALYYYTKERPAEEIAPPHSTLWIHRRLPTRYKPGYTLNGDDVEELGRLLGRRDLELERLYELESAGIARAAREKLDGMFQQALEGLRRAKDR